jgi:hypothetical protein
MKALLHTQILTIFLISISCSSVYIKNKQKRNQIIAKQYSIQDSIVLHDAIICGNYRKGWRYSNEPLEINQDSIFQVFSTALSKLQLFVDVCPKVNYHCDSSFQANYLMNLKQVDKEKLLEIAAAMGLSKAIMVPVIYIDTWDVKRIGVTASSGGTVENELRDSHVKILISIIKETDIVYQRLIQFSAKSIDLSMPNHPITTIEQKHWDKLVELVMRDYIKRMK